MSKISFSNWHKNSIGIYFQFIRLSFLKGLAYRLRYYTGVITYLVHVAVYWFIWEAVYKNGGKVGGFSFEEMATYVALGWVVRSFYFNNIDWDIQSRIISGDIIMDLSRPVDFQGMQVANALGESLFRLLLFALPAGIVICTVFPVLPPPSLGLLLAFIVANIGAFLINLHINFMVGLLAFKTQSIMGIMRAKYVAMQILTGLIVPISLYPEWAQTILNLSPFPYIAYVPLAIYLGKLDQNEIFKALGIQLFWIVALYFVGKYFWRICLKRLVIQGG